MAHDDHDNRKIPEAEDEAEIAFQRYLARADQQRHMQEHTLVQLSSVLSPERASLPMGAGSASPLLLALQAIGEVLGVTIRPAAKSEDPERQSDPLQAIARASHLRLRQVRLRDQWWRLDSGPLLAYRREAQQPVALLPISATRYELFDPEDMSRIPVDAHVAANLAPMAYTIYRPFPASPHHWWELLNFGLRGHGRDGLLILLTGVGITLMGMLTPQAMAILIDRAIPDAQRELVFQLGGALLATALGQALFQLAQGFALLRIQTGMGAAIEAALWDHLLKLAPTFFRQYATGDLYTRLAAVRAVQQRLGGVTFQTLLTGILALLNLVLMFVYSVPLAGVASGLALGASLLIVAIGTRMAQYVRRLQRLQGELSGVVVQLINGIPKLRIAGAQLRAFAYWSNKFSQQQRLLERRQNLGDHVAVLNAVLPTLISAVLFWWTIQMLTPDADTNRRALSAGTFLAFHAALGLFMGGMARLSQTLLEVLEVMVLWDRTQPVLTQEPEVNAGQRDPGRLTGKIDLEQVTFGYHDQGPVVLEGVSLSAEPGDFIALVGPSGSGKSTLLRLLLGFESPQHGAVFYDHQDLAHLDIAAVRRQIGTVLQQTRIMAASIFDNIAGGVSISLDEAWAAAQAAALDVDIAAMPMQMHTVVSEGGSNLSGGQRQRLLIARALVFKPAIVLFDEATSALDNRTQAIVTKSLDQLQATRVVIAHRLSTVRHADRIYVIDGGRIVQQGRYEELVQQEGVFAQLMARQILRRHT